MSLCEHGKYEGHCSECIAAIPNDPMGEDTPTPDSEIDGDCKYCKSIYKSCPACGGVLELYTIEAVIKMVMEHSKLTICEITPFGLNSYKDINSVYEKDHRPESESKPVIKLITEKGLEKPAGIE